MEMINITIDGKKIQVPKTATVLEAASSLGIKIPTLCYHPELRPEGSCRVCMVEVEGARSLVASCVQPINEDMVVRTNTEAVRDSRKMVVELLLANHPQDCLTCQRNLDCELQMIAAELGVREVRFVGEKKSLPLDDNNPSLVRDQNKCILCGRCIRACSERQGVHVYSFTNRGFNTTVTPAFNQGLDKAPCTFCGQCASVCPTAAIVEKDDTAAVWQVLSNPEKHVVVQTAPAIRVALGEALGTKPGSIITGKMVAALRRLGFDKVFDTVFGADVTIMEEGSELIERLTHSGTLPMITSCCPGWVNFVEMMYPDLLDHLSTTKSPHQILGALIKSYYPEKDDIEQKDIICVSIMPCTAKKGEIKRDGMQSNGHRDVDYVLTTRELARMIREAGIDFNCLDDEEFDTPLGISTGAGVIFGTTGGVMEAALRTVSEVVAGKTLDCIEFHHVRGFNGVREAVVSLGDFEVKIALAHGLDNARKLLEKIKSGEADYHFIEIMACHGGCIGGAGQPAMTCADTRQKRMEALYACDQCSTLRKSHDNPAIKELYDAWLGKPLSEKSHHLLHTHYHPQERC
jgi:NADP-reducing hydrogenase subunit HndD